MLSSLVCALLSPLIYSHTHAHTHTHTRTHTHTHTRTHTHTHTQVVSLADSEQSVEVEQHLLNSRLKALTAYFGELANAEF